jgi:asparagine synthase (glutamine-hydrolysing)
MCGIFALLNQENISPIEIENEFMKGQKRGPEFSKLEFNYMKMVLGFHRLAINGLNSESNQPIVFNNIVLICNGEIYNYKALYHSMGVVPITGSDCEVIIHLYLKYGMEQTLVMLDGVFAFILYDNRIMNDLNNQVYIARDPLGVRPLYYLHNINDADTDNDNNNDNDNDNDNNLYNLYGFASELKCLEKFYNKNPSHYSIEQFTPGTYSVFNLSNKVQSIWQPLKENIPYFLPTFSYNQGSTEWEKDRCKQESIYNSFSHSIANCLSSAVNKRCLTTERPIACLLSGGLDSSLISALVSNYYKINNVDRELETYSIGLQDSEDLKYARVVADWIGSNHTEIVVTEREMFLAIPEVIYAIESYDTTTVRASIGNYLLGKYIDSNSQAKVIFNGDGSDELLGGYLYMGKCPDDIEFDKETRRLLKDIHLFDVLRSDKSISSNGLEPRTPFLDRNFVNLLLSIPPFYRNHKNFDVPEKNILRQGFKCDNSNDSREKQLLPDEILYRKKEAFSDGVSSKGRSLYVILQEFIAVHLNIEEATDKYIPCIETEKYYYKKLFDRFYPNCSNILPYFWMPKYTDAKDPSARTLTFYKEADA